MNTTNVKWLGLSLVHGMRIDEHADRLDRLAELVLDPRWHYGFRLIDIEHVPGVPPQPIFKGSVSRDKLPAAAREALGSRASYGVGFGVSRKPEDDHARLYVEPGRTAVSTARYPYTTLALWHVPSNDVDFAVAGWLALADAWAETLSAAHGVIVAANNRDVVRCELWLSNISIDGRPVHPNPAEISALAVERKTIGDSHVRPPRWGTYMRPAHVEAIGGVAAIREAVQPAVLREAGELLYVQLTEHVRDALSAESEAKRVAFARLLAPITVQLAPS